MPGQHGLCERTLYTHGVTGFTSNPLKVSPAVTANDGGDAAAAAADDNNDMLCVLEQTHQNAFLSNAERHERKGMLSVCISLCLCLSVSVCLSLSLSLSLSVSLSLCLSLCLSLSLSI